MRRPDFRTPPSFFLILIVSVLATDIRKSVQEQKTIAFAIRSVDRWVSPSALPNLQELAPLVNNHIL